MSTLNRHAFRIPRGVDHVLSVRPRWSEDRTAIGYMVIRIWHDGHVEDIAGPEDRAWALARAEEVASREGTVYMRAPDDVDLARPGPLFGEVPGIRPGRRFRRREDLRSAGLHRRTQGGIDWTSEGAVAVVFAGGYADDEWGEDEAWYTGMGGQDRPGGRQVRDQDLTLGNRALMRNFREGLPVRVIRREAVDRDYEYVYEGLFYVTDFAYAPSRYGPKVYRFRLRRG